MEAAVSSLNRPARGIFSKTGNRHPMQEGNSSRVEEGTDLWLVQAALGHEDIKSTTLYTEVTQGALTAAMQRLP